MTQYTIYKHVSDKNLRVLGNIKAHSKKEALKKHLKTEKNIDEDAIENSNLRENPSFVGNNENAYIVIPNKEMKMFCGKL